MFLITLTILVANTIAGLIGIVALTVNVISKPQIRIIPYHSNQNIRRLINELFKA